MRILETLALSLLVPLSVVTTATPQDPIREVSRDPFNAAESMKAEEPLDVGLELLVLDGETGEPQPRATVLFLAPEDFQSNLLEDYDGDSLLAALARAVQIGRKWTTDEAGQVKLPKVGHVFAVHGRRFGVHQATRSTIELFPRSVVTVRVEEHDGSPATGLGVTLMYADWRWNSYPYRTTATTNENGQARIELPPHAVSITPKVAVDSQVVCERLPMAEVLPGHTKSEAEPVVIRLPELGRLRIVSLDQTGKPRKLMFTQIASGPIMVSRPTPDGLAEHEYRAALGEVFEVHGTPMHQIGEERIEVVGPKKRGEIVTATLDARIDPRMITARIFHDGRPFANRRVLHRMGRWAVSDADGRVWLALYESDVRLETFALRGMVDGDDPFRLKSVGAVAIPMTGAPGPRDLGRVDLEEESLLVGGRVIDQRGVPIEGALVTLQTGNAIHLGWSAQTDASGRFALHMLRPHGFEKVGLQVTHQHSEPLEKAKPLEPQRTYPAGAADVEIVMRRLR